jgi:hypothetical protein
VKPSLDIKDVNIEMGSHRFNNETLSFYANNLLEYPDEIDITVVRKNWNEEDKRALTNETYIFLDNYLGELDQLLRPVYYVFFYFFVVFFTLRWLRGD